MKMGLGLYSCVGGRYDVSVGNGDSRIDRFIKLYIKIEWSFAKGRIN